MLYCFWLCYSVVTVILILRVHILVILLTFYLIDVNKCTRIYEYNIEIDTSNIMQIFSIEILHNFAK